MYLVRKEILVKKFRLLTRLLTAKSALFIAVKSQKRALSYFYTLVYFAF